MGPFRGGRSPDGGSAARNPANRKAIIDLTTGNRLSSYWLDTMVRRSLEESTVEAFGAGHYAMDETRVRLATILEQFLG
jgi:hypothetical protein